MADDDKRDVYLIDKTQEMTLRARNLVQTAEMTGESIFHGTNDIKPTDYLDQVAENPKRNIINDILFLKGVHDNHPDVGTGRPVGYDYARTHYGRSVKEGEKGIPSVSVQISKDSNDVKYRGSADFILSETEGEPLPRSKSDYMKTVGTFKYSDAFDAIAEYKLNSDDIRYSEHCYLSEQMSDYIFEKYFESTMDEYYQNQNRFDVNEMNELIVDEMKDMSWDEIQDVLAGAMADASAEIDIMQKELESELENKDCFREAKLFGVDVLCAFDNTMRTSDMDILSDGTVISSAEAVKRNFKDVDFIHSAETPINMYAYEVYTKDGHDLIAKETPDDGKFKAYILTADAIPNTDGPGLSVGNTFVPGRAMNVSVSDFRKEHEHTPMPERTFNENSSVLRNNEKLLMQEPSEHLRMYGVYSGNQLIDAGYIGKGEVPEDGKELLDMIDSKGIGQHGDKVLLNAGGEISMVTMGRERTNDGHSFTMNLTESVAGIGETRAFIAEHGGNAKWPVMGSRAEAKVQSAEKSETRHEKSADDMPKRQPLGEKVRKNAEISHDTSRRRKSIRSAGSVEITEEGVRYV